MSASAVLKLQKAGFTTEQVEALADFMDTQAASKADLLEVEHRLDGKIESVRTEIELTKRDLKIWFGTALITAVGILLAAIRYLPAPHP